MYIVAFGWLVSDYIRSGSTEIWFLVGLLFLGVMATAYVYGGGRTANVEEALRLLRMTSFTLGTGLIAFSGLGARGVTLEVRGLVFAITLVCGFGLLSMHLVRWIRRRAQDYAQNQK